MHIHYRSLMQVLDGAPSGQVVIYGFKHCEYEKICLALLRGSALRPYNWSIGLRPPGSYIHTLEGRAFNVISERDLPYKAGIVNVVLENFRREAERKPLIHLMFCVDINENPFPKAYTIPELLGDNSFVTCSEIRRAYKLIGHDYIGSVAQRTFRFVKVERSYKLSKVDYAFCEIQSPWDNPEWADAWHARKRYNSQKKAEDFSIQAIDREKIKQSEVSSCTDWRSQLNRSIKKAF